MLTSTIHVKIQQIYGVDSFIHPLCKPAHNLTMLEISQLLILDARGLNFALAHSTCSSAQCQTEQNGMW